MENTGQRGPDGHGGGGLRRRFEFDPDHTDPPDRDDAASHDTAHDDGTANHDATVNDRDHYDWCGRPGFAF